MADRTSIEWTDATVNFWWGCTKVGPGCDHCYAETWDKRTGGAHWGPGAPRRKIKGAPAALQKLNRTGGTWVFIQSMSDLFDKEVPVDWFNEAWIQILCATKCHLQIVTKRISAVEKRLSQAWRGVWPAHAGLMITVVNQAEADRDIPRLLALKTKLGIPWVGLSMEPLLGRVVLRPEWLAGLDWVITGGESGPGARPAHIDWFRSIRDQCVAAGVAYFHKQNGEWASICEMGETDALYYPAPDDQPEAARRCRVASVCMHADGHVVQMGEANSFHTVGAGAFAGPRPMTMFRVGKARAGRLLDGREWNQMPGVQGC